MAEAAAVGNGVSRSALTAGVRQIGDMLGHSLEAGIGDREKSKAEVEKTIDQIQSTREALGTDRLAEAEKALALAWLHYREAVSLRGWLWRASRFGPHLLLFQLLMLGLILGGASRYWPTGLAAVLPEWTGNVWSMVPAAAFGFGALGGILRSLYWLGQKVSGRQYRAYSAISHFSAPFVGALFGALVYLLLKAGILVLEGPDAADPDNRAIPYALAFLVGFRWQSMLEWIDSFRIGPAPASPAAPVKGPDTDPSSHGAQPPPSTASKPKPKKAARRAAKKAKRATGGRG